MIWGMLRGHFGLRRRMWGRGLLEAAVICRWGGRMTTRCRGGYAPICLRR